MTQKSEKVFFALLDGLNSAAKRILAQRLNGGWTAEKHDDFIRYRKEQQVVDISNVGIEDRGEY